MALRRYDPWDVLHQFRDEMNRLFDERDTGSRAEGDASSVVTSAWSPAVDIKEESDRYLLLADLPGVGSDDIEVAMEGGVLTIRGERRPEQAQGEGYRRVERAYGAFYRRFSLPDTADAESISAQWKNGVLEVSIPKKEKAQARRITVS